MEHAESWDIAALLWGGALLFLMALLFATRLRAHRKRLRSGTNGLGRAVEYVTRGRYPEARRLLERELAEDLTPAGSAGPLVGLLALLRHAGDSQRALGILEAFGRKSLSLEERTRLKAELYLSADEPERAFHLLNDDPHATVELLLAAAVRASNWDAAVEVYEQRVEKKAWSKKTLGFLTAGRGLALRAAGEEELAAELLSKASKLDPDGLLVNLALALTEKDEEKRQLAIHSYDDKWPALAPQSPSRRRADTPGAKRLAEAMLLYQSGERERALGILRDFLDQGGKDILVRTQYVRWIMASEQPERWRHQLAETIGWLEESQESECYVCGFCGYASSEILLICPNCHAMESISVTGGRVAPPHHRKQSSRASGLKDLISDEDLLFLTRGGELTPTEARCYFQSGRIRRWDDA